jgi:hypothetical protein
MISGAARENSSVPGDRRPVVIGGYANDRDKYGPTFLKPTPNYQVPESSRLPPPPTQAIPAPKSDEKATSGLPLKGQNELVETTKNQVLAYYSHRGEYKQWLEKFADQRREVERQYPFPNCHDYMDDIEAGKIDQDILPHLMEHIRPHLRRVEMSLRTHNRHHGRKTEMADSPAQSATNHIVIATICCATWSFVSAQTVGITSNLLTVHRQTLTTIHTIVPIATAHICHARASTHLQARHNA